jgi:hypothetical protein
MNPVVSWLKANLVFTVVLFVALQGSVAHPYAFGQAHG